MANLLDSALNPGSAMGGTTGGQGPQSGVNYFGDIGERRSVSLRRPQQQAPQRRSAARPTTPEPGMPSLAASDSAMGSAERMVDTSVPGTAPGQDAQRAPTQLGPGRSPIMSASQFATGARIAGLVLGGPAAAGLSLVGGLASAADKDQRSMDETGERDMSGFVRAPAAMAGMNPIGLEGGISALDAARRYADDDDTNNPTFGTYAAPMARAVLGEYASDDAKKAMSVYGLLNGPEQQQRPGIPAEGVSVTTRAAIQAQQAAQAQAAAEQAAREAAARPQPGIPTSAVQGAPQGGFDNESFNPDAPGAVDAMDSVNQFTDRWGNMGQGSDGGIGGGVNGSAGSGMGSDSDGGMGGDRGFAADGGLAGPEGFSRPGIPAAGPRAPAMSMGDGSVQMGNAPSTGTVQQRVQQVMRDPAALQRLVSRPMALLQSGELTSEEVMTLGRVAEAAMYNPALYPQLRAFVAEQGMTPLPPSFDPSIITNILVISKVLQAQMPGTPAGEVPPTEQAQVDQPVPGFGNGGYIRGPGTGRSDSIGTINESSGAPVKVANDEYIIPAHVVRAKGREFFDNLLQRYAAGGQPGAQNG